MKPDPFVGSVDEPKSLLDRVEDALLPLINVVFLLLMFFLIAGIILQDELPPLPDGDVREDGDRPRLDLVIDARGTLRFEGRSLEASELADVLPEYDEASRLRVGAHESLAMSDLESAFQTLSEAGHPEVILLMDEQR